MVRRILSHLLLRILEDFALVVSDHDFFVIVIKDVSWIDRDLTSAPWCVDDELRYRVPGRVTSQALDNLDPRIVSLREFFL